MQFEELVDRVQRLERSNKRLRLLLIAVLLTLGACVGIAASQRAGITPLIDAQTIRVQTIEIVNSERKRNGIIDCYDSGCRLEFETHGQVAALTNSAFFGSTFELGTKNTAIEITTPNAVPKFDLSDRKSFEFRIRGRDDHWLTLGLAMKKLRADWSLWWNDDELSKGQVGPKRK